MGSLYKRHGNPTWQATFVDGQGARRYRSTRTSNKESAKLILAKWETDAAIRIAGVIDPAQERIAVQAARPIAEHIREFRQSIESPGNTAKHVGETIKIINSVTAQQSIANLRDIQPEHAERHASDLRKRKMANRTIQKHLCALKQFTRWAHESGRLQSDPLIAISPPTPDRDRRLERRALIPDSKTQLGEWPWLREATQNGSKIGAMSGEVRALLYELTLQTGLRHNEVRQLSSGKLHLDQARPYVLLPSRSTKNAKPARQFIGEDLRDRLMKYAAKRRGRLFDLPAEQDLAGVVREDLASARDLWISRSDTPAEERMRKAAYFLTAANAEGHTFDFHALRHTCGAWLAQRGVNPKTIQTIMRHSSITLTMDTYGHMFPDSAADAIAEFQPYFQSKLPLPTTTETTTNVPSAAAR